VLTVINGGFSSPDFLTLLPFPVVGVFSSVLLPGFPGPESPVLPVDLPPSVPPRFGFSLSGEVF
jgi:hypothetical protein